MKKKSKVLRIILFTGIVIVLLFTCLTFFTVRMVSKSAAKTAGDDIQIMSKSYADYVSSWLTENLNLLDFYVKSECVYDSSSPQEIGLWLSKTVSRRPDELDYVLFIDTNGNSFYDSGKTGFHGDREYFSKIMNGEKTVITEPTLAKATGRVSIMLVRSASDSAGNAMGMFVGVKSIEKIQQKINEFSLGESGYAFMLSGDGTVMCYPAENIQMKENFLSGSFAERPEIKQMAEKMVNGEFSSIIIHNPEKPWQKENVFFCPVENTNWSVAVCVPEAQIKEASRDVRNILIYSNAGIAVIVIVMLLLLMLDTFRPVKLIVDSILGIASGNADLTQRVDVKHNDEIGAIGLGFNKFMEKLQTIMSELKTSKTELEGVDENLQASTLDTGNAIEEILSHIESIKNVYKNQAESVDGTASAITQISSNIQSLEQMIENQSAGVTQASAAIEQMIGNINAINHSIDKMAEEFTELQQKSEAGSSKQSAVSEQIMQIENQSSMLQEANAAISSIAEQTNLLAMNAAIEAAHAGDAGKGFSVVADEIRKLSETSSSQSRTIGEQLQKIRESIGKVVESSGESHSAFNAVSVGIKQTDELVRQIKGAMDEQTEGSRQILESLRTMSDSTVAVKMASTEMAEGSTLILGEVSRLKDASGILSDSIAEVNSSTEKIKDTGNALKAISGQMKTTIKTIGDEIDLFKV